MSFGGFGSSSANPTFGSSTFGQPAQQTSLFGASTPTNTFGAQPATSSTSGWPAFGSSTAPTTSGFGTSSSSSVSGSAVKSGTQHTPYTTTTEATGKGRMIAISAMPAYKDKSFEELRYEDYTMLKGQTPIPTVHPSTNPTGFGTSASFVANPSTGFVTPSSTASGTGFGTSSTPAPGSSSWGSSFANPSTTTPSFGGGFGSSTTSTFGVTASSPFGTSTSSTAPAFGFGSSTQPSTTTFGNSAPASTGFGTSSTGTFGTAPSTGFGTTAPSTTSGFGTSATPSTGFGTSTFGSTPAPSTGFGTSTFGQPSTSTTAFGTGTFGSIAPSTPSFGQASTQSTGMFGSTTTTQPPSGGLFGSGISTVPTSSTSLFGAQPSTGTTTAGLFGQPATGTTAPGGVLFGQQSASTTQPFGSGTTPGTGGTGLFGTSSTPAATGTGLFGQSSTTTTATQQPTTGLFGQAPKPPSSSPFTFGSTAGSSTSAPGTTTGFGTTSTGLFGSQPATGTHPSTSTTSLFGAPAASSLTAPSTGFGFGSTTTQTQPSSLFGGASTTAPSTAPSFSFGAASSSTGTTQPSLFGTGQQTSLFGAGATGAKPPPTSLFGAPSTTTPSFQFGSATSSIPSTQPATTGSLFGGFGASTSAPLTLSTATPQTQLQPYSTPLKAPPSIDSNPFGLKELPAQRPDSTNLTFQSSTPAATPKSVLQRPGFTTTKPTPQSVARLRTRVRHTGLMTPAASLSPFDDKIFSISTLTTASKSVIPKVFRPQMPPKVELPDHPTSPVQSPPVFNGRQSTPNTTAGPNHIEDSRRSMNSVLESPIPISSPIPKSRSLIASLRSLADRGYTFSPSLETLESMSDSQLRCVTLQITKSGCGYARWTDFDLFSWSNHDLKELIFITDKTVKLKGPAKRGNVVCGIKAKTEMQASKLYEEKVRQFMAAKGFELLGLDDGYYSFKCNFANSNSNSTTPSFQVR